MHFCDECCTFYAAPRNSEEVKTVWWKKYSDYLLKIQNLTKV